MNAFVSDHDASDEQWLRARAEAAGLGEHAHCTRRGLRGTVKLR